LGARSPPKLVQVVCIQLSELQKQLYAHFLDSKRVRALLSKNNQALPAITLLKKLCNHPLLIREASSSQVAGYDECLPFFPPDYGRARDGSRPDTSGKLLVLQRLLHKVRTETDERFVLVSNYTSMLDLFATMAREFGWSYVRLDGSTSQKKRTQLVAQFNEKQPKGQDIFLFLLSSKAGGCGLNLIGGNRLVLFDPDWNPANDKQAAARVWRDGQTKRVYIYRFVVAGSIEEFVYERQLSKEGLAGVASNEQVLTSALSSSELKDLFIYHDNCTSHFHDKLKVSGRASPCRAPARCGRSARERLSAPRGSVARTAAHDRHRPSTACPSCALPLRASCCRSARAAPRCSPSARASAQDSACLSSATRRRRTVSSSGRTTTAPTRSTTR
jgi:DNA repair and recombination RAD54-like protein